VRSAESWWPSPFGEDDQLGMLNHVDDAKRLDALALVRRGRLYDLGRVLDEASPVFPGRYFRQTLVTTAHHGNANMPVGENEVNWITEVVSGTTQLGTHLDTLGHLQQGGRGYNGWTVSELAGPAGLTRLGAETIPQIVTRGWLVDVSGQELGIGGVIRPEHLSRVFDRFWRVDSDRARTTGGTGLGLAIVRAIAEAHGGTVAVASEPGHGSTFTCRLPGFRAATTMTPARAGSLSAATPAQTAESLP